MAAQGHGSLMDGPNFISRGLMQGQLWRSFQVPRRGMCILLLLSKVLFGHLSSVVDQMLIRCCSPSSLPSVLFCPLLKVGY